MIDRFKAVPLIPQRKTSTPPEKQRKSKSSIGSLDRLEIDPFPMRAVVRNQNGQTIFTILKDAIGDLPIIHSSEGTDGFQAYSREANSDYSRIMRDGSEGVYNHQAMKHTKRLVKRFALIPPGGKEYDLGRKIQYNNTTTVYKSNNQRLRNDFPSLCITANWQSSYLHPILDRKLTVREAARIQSFPDTFIFKGKRALMSSSLLKREGRLDEIHISQCHQVGNAVPPLLAKQIGKHLTTTFDNIVDGKKGQSYLEKWV